MCWMFITDQSFLYFPFETVDFQKMDMQYIALPKGGTCKLQPLSQQSYSLSLGTSENLEFQAHKSTLEKKNPAFLVHN